MVFKKSARGKYVDLAQAAQGTPYSAEYLRLLARKGKITSKKIRSKWFTTKESVNQYMQEHVGQKVLQALYGPAPDTIVPASLVRSTDPSVRAQLAATLAPGAPDYLTRRLKDFFAAPPGAHYEDPVQKRQGVWQDPTQTWEQKQDDIASPDEERPEVQLGEMETRKAGNIVAPQMPKDIKRDASTDL